MTIDTSIGLDDPRTLRQAGEDDALTDEEREAKARRDRDEGDAVESEDRRDVTREDIERGNDRNTSADGLGRAPRSNKLPDEGVQVGNVSGGEPDAR